jgi:predicted transcriptional regulator
MARGKRHAFRGAVLLFALFVLPPSLLSGIPAHAGESLAENAKEVGRKVKEMGKEVGEAAKNSGVAVGKAFKESGKATGEAFREMGREIREEVKGKK